MILTVSQVFSQEICTNGIDDDGDGFIDCYDGECSGGPSCADFFYGNPIICKDEPTENPTFAMRLQWGSEDRSADSHATPAVGDLDNDGLPEVVVINRLDERLFILNGEDGSTAFTYDLGYQPENGIVLANLDGGDCANIYVSRDNSSRITALDCEANLLWETNASDRVGIMGIADFNGDGNSELYYKTEIMDAATGNIIVTGTNDNWVQKYAHSAIAVDILDDAECADCSGLELITGNQIWAINIGAGTRTLAKDLNDLFAADIPTNNKRYYTKYFNTTQNRTCISVADYNQDGHVDVLMPGAYGSSNSSQTTIFFWDVFNNSYLVYDGGVNHNKGTGRLNVSDIDGDGLMNTTYVSDQILYALDENLEVLWTKGIDEGSSGFTGTTVFDFDGDGAAETIYRSESYLYIIDGTDGSTRTTIPCKSRTQEEYPLVADVDNDGSSELCVPCYTSDNTNFSPYSNTKYSQIRIYEADGGEIWQPSRRVWNQHGYFVVNVNDDLTIPAQQQDHTAIFGTTDCQTGATIENRALNGFLNQTTFLEADGCPSYVSPDVNLAGNINATPSQCPLNTFEVTFDIENTGDTDIYGTLPVTFYNGDPETSGATKLNTEFWNFNSTPLLEGATETLTFTVEGSGGDFDLYIALNNNGQDPPINLAGGGFPECDFTNNIGSVSVTYQTFTLTANKLEDNRRCDPSKPDNGEAEAYFEGTLGGELETIWSEDFTGLSNGSRSDAGSTAWTSSRGSFNPLYWGVNTKSGNKVYRTRKTGQNNEVSEVTWLSEEIDISGHTDIAVSLDMLTNNTLEASGNGRDYMRAFYILDGGAETEFDTNGELYGSFLYALAEQTGLNGNTLQIKVTFHTTGNGEYQFLDNVSVTGTSIPVTQIYTDADGFEFYWYNTGDYSSPVASGSLNTGMATGTYDVVGFYPASNCYSDTLSITINDSVPSFNVHVYEIQPYLNCLNPDGAIGAFVYTQEDGSGNPLDTITSGYSFSWATTIDLFTPVGTGPTLSNITGIAHQVTVEQLITGCVEFGEGEASSPVVNPPDPTVNKTDISACAGPGSTGDASASIGGVTAGYEFDWFYESIDGTPEYDNMSSISGLPAGTYFVRATDTGNDCPSDYVMVEILDTSGDPTPTATQVQADNGCNTNNGIATADGDGAGTTAGYTFDWFAGNNTLDANKLADSFLSADRATASGLASGIYTVRATIAGCSSTDTVKIFNEEVIPEYNIVTQVDAGNALQVLGKAIVSMPQLISGTSEFTVSYWVEISTNNYTNDHRIFSSGGKNESQMMLWTSDEFGISFVIKADGDSDVGKINTFYKPTGWVQLTGTWNEATGEMKLYANGVKIGETTYFGDDPTILEGVVDNGPDMYIAGDGNFGVNKFEGRIDEVKIYNRALDETEILAELCDPAGGSTSGLQVHYDFNDVGLNTTQGSTVPDISGNGNDGTLDKPGAGSPGSWAYVTSGIQCPLAGMVNNTSCDPANPNGEIDLTGAVDPVGANYEYTLYEGTEVDPDTTITVNTTGIFSNLQDGFYTVVTTDVDSDCSTDPLTLSIATLPEQPSIITDITDNTGCTIGAGEILATSSSVSAEPASYTYELYDGWSYTTLLETETVADGSTGFSFTGLTTGEYRIRVINDDILCEDYVDVYVDDASSFPSFNDGSTIINHNTVCSGTANGFTSVAVNGGNANHTFEWYDGGTVNVANLRSETDEFLDELSAGQYTVVATSTITGCKTPPKVITIYDQPVYPDITTDVVNEQTACDYGNGTLYAFVTEPGASDCVECTEPDNYGFQWYLGTDTSTPLVENTPVPGNESIPIGVDSSVVTGLTADDYTVVVTNLLTGCSDTTSATISYEPMPPTIDPANSTVEDNTSCESGNGSIVASVDFSGETINGADNNSPWEVITDCNTEVGLDSNILPDGSIEITPDVNNQAGKAYLGDSVDFNSPTRIDFWMYLGDKDSGADGITFIFHRDPDGKDALGRYGCNLGIGDESCFGGTQDAIQPSVAVEFDTYNNGGATKDPSYDHTAFVIDGDMSEPQGDVGVFYNANQPTIVQGKNDVENDDAELRVTITIVPNLDGTQTFSVYVEDELRLQRTQDFINDLFGGESKTIAGYTASTGGARNQQYVRIDPYFGEYDFAWYEGGTVDENNRIPDESSPYLCDLFAGDYTYVVTYNGTGCESEPATFNVANATDTANVSLSGISNTVCDPALALAGNYTGSLTANTASDPSNYTFAWFEGATVGTDTISTDQTLDEIPGGDYTVAVQNIVSGCIRIKDTTLVDVTVDPAILDVDTDVTVQNVTVCEGASNYPNGSITINSVDGTGPYGYWYWYGTDSTSGTFLADGSDIFTQTGAPGTASVNVNGNGTATLTGLSAGDYTIIVIDSASGCTSVEANIEIIDDPTIPNLVQNTSPNTVCDPALAASGEYDGEVEISTNDGSDAVADYTYDWYEGTGTTTAISVGTVTANILSEAPDGNYTVVATSAVTGCDTTIYATIGDATVNPTITSTSVQNVTACEGGVAYPNGSITVDGVTGTGPFEYMYWYGADTITGTLLVDGSDIFTQTSTAGTASVNVSGNGTATLNGLSAGDYTIIIADLSSGCTSVEANVQIINVPTIPELDQSITDNTVCDNTINNALAFDGEVEIVATDGSDATTDYSYVWYDGTGTTTPTSFTVNNNILSEAPDGNYTVVATSNSTGCDTTIYATIGDATVDPVLGTIDVTDMTVCDGAAVYPNGGIEVNEGSITNGSGDYSYEFYWGSSVLPANLLSDGDNIVEEKTGTPDGLDISITGNIISNLDTGFYTIVVIDNVSGCTGSEQTVEIEDVLIDINVPVPTINHYTNCDDPDGSITVSPDMASGPEPALGYSYQWYFGSGTGNTLDASDLADGSELAGVTSATVSGLEDGTYTVLITNNDTGCDTEEEYDVQDQRVYPVVDPGLIVTTPNINCSGTPTGTIDPTGSVSEAGPYVFTLYDASDAVIDTEDTDGGDDGIFENLAADNYKIGVELASGCTSVATASVTVEDDFTLPGVDFTKLSDETSCIAPNGQIRINSPGSSPTAGFDIIVYSGIGTGGAVQETIADDYTGAFPIDGTADMDNGTYTIQILDNDTGCDSLRQVTINEVPDAPTLVSGNVTRTHDTYCTSDNGTIVISTVTNPGTDPVFNLYSGSSVGVNFVTSAQPGVANHTFTGLAAGTYTVSVIKDESGCESNGITRTINENEISFTPGVTVFSDQSSCLISDPNGELIASIAAAGTGPSTDVNDYNFEWYQGQNTNPANRITSGGIITTAVVSGTNDSRVSGLPTGTYRLKVIEPVSGCFYTIDETIDLVTVAPTIPGGGINITDADQCAPSNGEIEITVNDGGSTQPYDGAGGYTFEIFDGAISPMETPLESFNQTVVSGAPAYEATYTFENLDPGDYTIRVTDNNTSCLVTSTLQTVNYIGATLAFDETNMVNSPLSACFDENGILDIGTSLTIPGNTDPVIITWYVGTDTTDSNQIIGTAIPTATESNIINYGGFGYDIINGRVEDLPAVSYTGVAELSNGCKFILETNLSIVEAPDVVSTVSTPTTRCEATFDGEINIEITPVQNPNPPFNDNFADSYDYYLFPGIVAVSDDTPGTAPWTPDVSTYGATAGNDGTGDGEGTFPNTGANTASDVTISELEAGDYTVVIVINTASGCVTNVQTITIDPPTGPEVTLDTKTDNTVCDIGAPLNLDYNGSITVDAEHPDFVGSTFTFEWYYDNDGDGDFTVGETPVANGADGAGTGSFVTGATTTDALTATLSGVGPGWYRVIATHTDANNGGADATACPDTLDIEIFDDFVELAIQPAAIVTQTNVLDCGGGPEEFGEFEIVTIREDGVDLGALASDGFFDISWEYDNGGGYSAYTPSDIELNHSDDLEPGDYRITIVSTTTACDISYDFTIEDETEDPVINLLGLTDNTICVGGPLGLEANGQIVIEIQDELGAVQDPVNYDITWYLAGIGAGNDIPANQIPGANFTTTAVDVTVDDLPGGTYWVEVTKNNGDNEQCMATASFELDDDPAEVSIQQVLNTDYTRSHQTDCSPDENGVITLLNVYEDGIADPVSNGNYLFNWYDDDMTTPITVGTPGGTYDETVSDLPAGTYYVEAENQSTDCVSEKVPFTINDNRVIPNLQLAQTLPDTTCVGSLAPSGEVTASVILPGGGTGAPGDYTFTWYEGIGTGTPITVGAVDGAAVNGEMYEQLPAGTYTVEVEDNVTPGDNCTATAQITVSRFTPIISIQTADITIQNDLECSIDNGSATVNAVTITKFGGGTYKINSGDAEFADFDFNWFFTATGGVSQDNDNVFDLRPAGTYFVTVSNTQTMCAMPTGVRKAVTIQDVSTLPSIQLVAKTPDEYCTTVANEGDGSLNIKIVHEGNNPADPLDYTVEWFRGTGTGTALAGGALGSAVFGGVNDTALTGLSTGTYTVRVSKNGTPNDGCSVTQTFTINRDAPTMSLPLSSMTIQDNLNCTTPNGSITINSVLFDGVADAFPSADDYTINWTGIGGATVNSINETDDQVTGLAGGTYTVDITNDRTGCTVSADITIDDDTSNPLIQLVTKTPDEYCSTVTPNEGDGSLIIKLVHENDNPADSTLYNIEWFRGTGTGTLLAGGALGSAIVSPNGTGLTGLSAGTYTVRVTDANTPNLGCVTTQTFTINRDAPTIALPLSSMTIQNNQNCSNPNGSITINGVLIDGVADNFPSADDYTISWTGIGGATVNSVNETDDQVVGLTAGTYGVMITNDRTGCTVSANVQVQDVNTTPLVQLVIKSADEYCDNTGFQGNGSLEMKIIHEGNNPADPLDYNIQWFRGTGTGTTLASTLGSAVIGGNGTQLSGLATGTYTVVVTKNGTPNDQCFKQVTFSIVRDAPNFSIQTTSVAVTDNTNCNNPNGVIEITNVIVDGTVVDLSTTPDNYSFSWPDGFGGGTPGANNFPNDIATDLPAGTYRIVASNTTTGCSTDTIAVVVDDVPTQPALSFVVDNPNQNCGPTKNGQLTVTATTADGNPVTNVGRYTFTWYDGKGTSTLTSGIQTDGTGASDNTSVLSALDSGYYTVEVLDNTNFCTVTGTYAVGETLDNPQLLKADIVVRADTTCDIGSSGTIIVADSSFVSGDLDDYNVEIRSGSSMGPILAQSTAGLGNTDLTISSLDPGTFYITATRAATECDVAPVRVNILDQRFGPDIILDSLIANPNCGGTVPAGSIITTADGFDETNPDYLFQWYEGTVGGGLIVPAGNGGNSATIFDVTEGQYELEVTNLNTGCVSTQIFDIPAIQMNPRITSYGVSNNLLCSNPGSGSFEINQITFDDTFYEQGITADSTLMVSDFTYEFFESDQTTPLVDSEPATPLEMNGLSAGTYYARVRRDDSQCASGLIEFIIEDLPQYPVIQLSQIEADSTCNGLNPNGTLTAIVDGIVNDTLYTYNWYEVDGSGNRIGGSLSTNDTINGLATGRYELEVFSLISGCTSTARRNVTNAPVEVEILSVTTTDPTTCSPANGVIEVTSITPGILTDYTFDFFLGDPSNGGVNVQSALGSVYTSGAPGVYYIQATHNVYGCVNNLYEVELEDNLVYPDIELVSFANQTNCDPGNPNGSLSATADGSTDNVAYNFEWRDELDNIIEPNNASVSNLAEGTYTLTVTDNSTGCMISQSFDIADEIIQPFITTSTQPNTNCVDPNGVMNATVSNTATIGKPLNVYSFYWFNGHITDIGLIDTTNAVYTGTQVTDLLDGDYTVYVIDNTDAYCESFKTLTIQDGTFPPPFEIEVQNDVTICYDSLPNGRARIAPGSLEANRELFEFSYEWFEGTSADTAGQTPFVTGIRADSLTIGTYSVLATDLRTGCENLVTFNIIDDTEPVPGPSVNVVSDRDNCQFANGHAVASIGGTITGYRFDWYLASGDTSTVQFTGHEIFTLDSISYTVQATRLSTGCVSPRMPVDIINAIVDPEFEVKTTTSLCLRTEDGAFNQFTGTAEIIFSTFAVIDYIEWIGPDGTIYSNDIKLVNAEPGLWTVNFIAGNGCSYTADFSIQTALKIYNGVSANADGRNDYFFVDCIDYFPNNNVQIFNRDGTRVWEADGYDNASVRFEGFSNVGRAGLQLPTGTYFYIIEKGAQVGEVEDKTNRAKIQGYLELVR